MKFLVNFPDGQVKEKYDEFNKRSYWSVDRFTAVRKT